jgi:hypothetical protein
MVIFAAATGIRPAEWLALERRDIDREARVAYVRRSCTKGRLKCTKTEASPAPSAAASDRARRDRTTALKSAQPAALPGRAGRLPRPSQLPQPRVEAGTTCRRDRTYTQDHDLRHTFATFRAPCRHLHFRPLSLHGSQPEGNPKPSDGLEPSTPSLPCAPIGNQWQPMATVWLASAVSRVCDLQSVAAGCARWAP